MENTLEELEKLHNIQFVEYDDETNIIKGNGGFNVDWCDREGRHPWVELSFEVDMDDNTIECKGNISSKAGDIDIDGDEKSTFENIDEVVDEVEYLFSQILHEIEQG